MSPEHTAESHSPKFTRHYEALLLRFTLPTTYSSHKGTWSHWAHEIRPIWTERCSKHKIHPGFQRLGTKEDEGKILITNLLYWIASRNDNVLDIMGSTSEILKINFYLTLFKFLMWPLENINWHMWSTLVAHFILLVDSIWFRGFLIKSHDQ